MSNLDKAILLAEDMAVNKNIFGGIKTKSPKVITIGRDIRFIKLSLQGKASFHLDEVEVFNDAGINLALNKTVLCSSSFNDEIKYSGINLVNGLKTGGVGYHSKNEDSPWVLIDLGKIERISKIVVYNRDDKWAFRSKSMLVMTSDSLTQWNIEYDGISDVKELIKLVDILSEDNVNPSDILRLKAIAYACSIDQYRLQLVINEASKYNIQDEIYDVINNKLVDISRQFTSHGIRETFSLMEESHKVNLAKEIECLLSIIKNETGVDSFICAGTLLGLYRERAFIAHDDDIDIGYISNYSSEKDILEERKYILEVLNNFGYKTVKAGDYLGHYHVSKGSLTVDLFSGWFESDNAYLYPLKQGMLTKSDFYPLSTLELYGANLKVPRKPESVLVNNYGENWSEPNPLWRFNWEHVASEYSFLIK